MIYLYYSVWTPKSNWILVWLVDSESEQIKVHYNLNFSIECVELYLCMCFEAHYCLNGLYNFQFIIFFSYYFKGESDKCFLEAKRYRQHFPKRTREPLTRKENGPYPAVKRDIFSTTTLKV